MALSNAAIRAIAIRTKVKARQMTASSAVVANDNQPRARRRRATMNDACVAAAGFAEHAAR